MAVLAQPSSVDACREYLRLGIDTGFSCNVTQSDAASATTVNGANQRGDNLTVASTANMTVGCFIGIAVTGGTINRKVKSITSSTVVVLEGGNNVISPTDTGAVTIEPIDPNGPFTSLWASAAGTVKYVDLFGNLCTATLAASQRLRAGIARVYDTGTTITDANLVGFR